MMRILVLSACLCVGIAQTTGPRIPIPEFDVNLDLAPEERYTEVIQHFKEPLQKFVTYLHAANPIVKVIGSLVSMKRGQENPELQGEIRGIAKLSGVTEGEIHLMQMLYELNTLMIPIVNFTEGISDFEALEAVATMLESTSPQLQQQSVFGEFPIRFGCTGIIAWDNSTGTVNHARNLDFSFAKYLQAMAYTGIFKKNGSEVFRAQTIAGYTAILTGMRKGPNGYTIEINTRFTDHVGGNSEMFRNLFTNKREISGWTKRKVLEQHDNYEDAVEAFSNTPYAATEYNIVAGVKKGVILARKPDGLAYKLPLGENGKDYIIMTNFDYPWHDIKEEFDPTTVKGLFHPRRKAAEKILDAAKVLTPELLFQVLNDDAVMAKDTIFQVIMNVETGLWNASLPACVSCGRSSSMLVV